MNLDNNTPEKTWRDNVRSIIQLGKFIALKRREMSTEELVKLGRTEFGVDSSTLNKVVRIAEHPILSNPDHADRLPAAWGLLYELKFLPDHILLDKIRNNELLNLTKYDIWKLRGVKFVNGKPNFPPLAKTGARVSAADGQSFIDYVRMGMAKQKAEGRTIAEIAKELHLSAQTYRMVQTIISLSERPELSEGDKILTRELLEKIEKTRNVLPYYRLIKPLVEKVWGSDRNRQINDKGMEKRVDAFRSTIIIVNDTCERLNELEIPYMSKDDIDRSIDELTNAGRLIRKLAETLRRSKDG